jgi:hypothetical protein
MRDYKIHELKPNAALLDNLASVTVPEIAKVSTIFALNVNSVHSLCSLVAGLYYWGTIDGLHRAMAWNHVFGHDFHPDDELDPSRMPEILAEANKLTAKSLAKYRDHPEYEDLVWNGVNEDIKVLGVHADSWLGGGIETVLSAIVVATWTAFETLAADLWIACVNRHPRLALESLGAGIEDGDDEHTITEKLSKECKITAKQLIDSGFNLRDKMGDVLESDWKFTRSDQSREAWTRIFGGRKAELKKLFDDKNLRWLRSLRNSIVHYGGRAKYKFKNDVGDHHYLKTVLDGELYVLDGQLVSSLINPSISLGADLITFAEQRMLEEEG